MLMYSVASDRLDTIKTNPYGIEMARLLPQLGETAVKVFFFYRETILIFYFKGGIFAWTVTRARLPHRFLS